MRYFAAVGMALPVGAVGWFELIYLWFGFTGEDAPPVYNATAAVAAFGFAFAWPLMGTTRPAEVVRKGCLLGGIVAVLLPIAAIATMLLWERSSGRRDLGMGGLMLYAMPVVAFGVALVLALAFWFVDRWAARRLKDGAADSA